jgi:hypothetical protein
MMLSSRRIKRRTRAVLGFAERHITPARALAVVALAAVISLGAAQFGDYRVVEVGAPHYACLENNARPPEIDPRSLRSAHGDWVLGIAAASLLVLGVALTRNWRVARLLIFLGVAVVAISLAIDAPEGLREGQAGVVFQGARATLLGSFWVQLFSGVTLIVAGPILAIQLRAQRDAQRARRGGGRRSSPLDTSTQSSRVGRAAT